MTVLFKSQTQIALNSQCYVLKVISHHSPRQRHSHERAARRAHSNLHPISRSQCQGRGGRGVGQETDFREAPETAGRIKK